MNKRIYVIGCLIALIALLLSHQTVLAHQSVTVGDYKLEIGWVDEPPIAGQKNALLVIVSNTSGGEAQPVEDVSSLVVNVSYGDQQKKLTLQPLGEDTPGQFVAPLLPTIPGQYTVLLGGQLGDTDVDAHVEPEEVASADTLQFPSADSSAQGTGTGATAWLIWLSLLIGLIGVGLGVTALRKSR